MGFGFMRFEISRFHVLGQYFPTGSIDLKFRGAAGSGGSDSEV